MNGGVMGALSPEKEIASTEALGADDERKGGQYHARFASGGTPGFTLVDPFPDGPGRMCPFPEQLPLQRAGTTVKKRHMCEIGERRDHSRNHFACRRVRDRYLHTVDNRDSSRGYRGCLVDLGVAGARGRWPKALLVARQSLTTQRLVQGPSSAGGVFWPLVGGRRRFQVLPTPRNLSRPPNGSPKA